MSEIREVAGEENLSRLSETFAPQNAGNGAVEKGSEPSSLSSPPKATPGLSPWKHRFMTALVDKLKVNRTPKADPSGAGDRRGDDSREHLVIDARSATEAQRAAETQRATEQPGSPEQPLSARTREDWLAETHLGETKTRPMTFTYAPGSTPLPRYTIRRGIGVGGFGEVYFALTEAGKEVALKRIQRNLEVELRGVSHCLNLKHPNLVALFDICRDPDEQSWVVMEYVAGENLRQVLDRSPDGLPAEEVRRWFAAIASGVHHLHSAGLVHRDLKPGNVFDDLGIVKVGDYGLSKFISASHRGGHTESVGTFHYMAPEIGKGEYGREIDIYAMGIMLYELLTGEVPFDGESCHEIIVKHLTAQPDLRRIAEPYRSTIAKCLEKDPGKRFSNVTEMMASLGMSDFAPAISRAPTHVSGQIGEGVPVAAVPVAAVPSAEVVTAEIVEPAAAGHTVGAAPASPRCRTKAPTTNRLGGASLADEPFARAVKQSFADLNRWWTTLDSSPGAKMALLLVAGFVLLVNTHWLLPLLSFIAVFYVPYYIVRQMVLQVRTQPTYAQAQRIATAAGAPHRPLTRNQWRSYMRNDLRAKRSIHRVAELNTSWIAASFTAVGLALGAAIVGLRSGPVDALSIAPYGWMSMVVLIASLGILGMGKLWERDEGEALPRRLVLAGVGAGVGLAAFSVNEFLMLPLDLGLARDVDATDLPQAFYRDGVPLASAMMAHFALLFAALRWWKPVDPLRRTRLSLWSVTVAIVVEWAVHQILPIPQPAGMMIAGGIAIAVQLSAPWINPRAVRQGVSSAGTAGQDAARARSVA